MVKIITRPDCGNSPKMRFIKEYNIAFAKANMDFLTASVTDDIVWNIINDKEIEGKRKFTEELEKMKSKKVSELVIEKILSHGKEGAVSGIIKMQNGKNYTFADFYLFQGAKGTKIKAITSYVIEI